MTKTVLITGASSGLGMELAKIFARQGYDLILVARRLEKLKQLKVEIQTKFCVEVFTMAADLSLPETPAQIYQVVKDKGLRVDILINNAAMGLYGEFLSADFKAIEKMHQVNVVSPMYLAKLFLPDIIAQKDGQLVNIASIGGLFPGPLMAVYFAGKADVLSWTRALAYELRTRDITISVVCPGPFKTEFQEKTFGGQPSDKLPSSTKIAQEVFENIRRKKLIIIPGLSNKIIYWLSRFLPQSLILRWVYRFHKKLSLQPT